MANKKIDEVVFDAILEQAFSDVIDEDFQKLKENSEPISISAETDHKIRALFAGKNRRKSNIPVRNILRIAAVLVIVLLNIGLIGILMVPSVNAEVKNVFASLFEKYTSYETITNSRTVITTGDYEISYVPVGFELEMFEDNHLRFTTAENEDSYIYISIVNEDFGRASIDAESEEYQTIKINGSEAYLSFRDGDYCLFWHDGYYLISIFSNIKKTEIIDIAKNISRTPQKLQ